MKYLALFGFITMQACGSNGPPQKPAQPPVVAEDTAPATPPRQKPRQPVKPPAQLAYTADDELRINEIQMKGSHNSYHLASEAKDAPEWTQYSLPSLTEQLVQHGVRQFELDVHYYKNAFVVFHLPDLDQRTTCYFLSDCLHELNAWSFYNPGHHPIIVWLELKDEWDPEKIAPHIEELESAVLSVIPPWKLITPDDVQGVYGTLSEAAANSAWPTLGQARNKFLFVVMNEGEGRAAYTYGGKNLNGRAMFVTSQSWPYGVVAMIDDPVNQEANIYAAVAAGYLVRSRVDDLPGIGGGYAENLAAALRAGAHMIATDYPAAGAIPGYSVAIPGGMPSRCNPVTARAACTPALIEHPQLLQPAR